MRPDDDHDSPGRFLLAATLLSGGGLVTLWGIAASLYARLPANIPLHFDGKGVPDRWGPTTPANWYQLPAIGTLVIAAMVGVAWFSRWAAVRKPQLVNIPFKDRFLAASPARRAWIVEPIAAALALDGVAITALFVFILVGTERVANGTWPTLSPLGFFLLIPVLTLMPLAGVGWTAWRAGKA